MSNYIMKKESVAELTGLQRDLLVATDNIGPCNGQRIKDHLLDVTGYETVTDANLYKSFDVLVESGYVIRQQPDRRSNAYSVSPLGELALEEYRVWVGGSR